MVDLVDERWAPKLIARNRDRGWWKTRRAARASLAADVSKNRNRLDKTARHVIAVVRVGSDRRLNARTHTPTISIDYYLMTPASTHQFLTNDIRGGSLIARPSKYNTVELRVNSVGR